MLTHTGNYTVTSSYAGFTFYHETFTDSVKAYSVFGQMIGTLLNFSDSLGGAKVQILLDGDLIHEQSI